MAFGKVAIFQVLHTSLAGRSFSRSFECRHRLRIVSGDAAIHGKRQGCQRMSEQPALDFSQGNDRHNLPIAFGKQVVGTMMKHPFHDRPPLDPVKKGCALTGEDKFIPARSITLCVRTHIDDGNHS